MFGQQRRPRLPFGEWWWRSCLQQIVVTDTKQQPNWTFTRFILLVLVLLPPSCVLCAGAHAHPQTLSAAGLLSRLPSGVCSWGEVHTLSR